MMIEIKYLELLIQEFTQTFGSRNFLAIFGQLACGFLIKHNYTLYPISSKLEYPPGSIAYVEECYKCGWVAIINDGKLLGFKKAE